MSYNSAAKLQFLASNSPIDVLIPNFTQVAVQAAKQTVTIPVPTNWCYMFLSILFQGTGAAVTAAMIQEYRLKVNGILLHQVSGTQIDAINVYYKYPTGAAPAGVTNDYLLLIPFLRQTMRGANLWVDFAAKQFGQATIPDVEWETLLNCGKADPQTGVAITQVILEVDLVNTNPVGMTSIASSNKAKVLPASEGGPGALMFVNKTTFNAAIGTNQLIGGNGLLYGDVNHYYLDSLFLFPPAGTVDNFQFWLNSQEIFQRTAEENSFWQSLYGVRTPQAIAGGNMVVIDFCETGFADGVKYIAPQATSARLQFTESNAEGVQVVQRSVGYLG